ncbi:MAG: 3'-5' exonuclease [Burkholderiales bacterium]|nr:3'-5' exonuclease [Burkholderiales bacterium]
MRFLAHWLRRGPDLPAPLRERLAAWRALPAPPADAPLAQTRVVVADTETSGLDARADRLLSVGAVCIDGLRIDLASGFETVLRQTQVSTRANIVIHGIGEAAQRDGEDPAAALMRFLEFCGHAPLVAYHAPFDEAFVRRALATHLGAALRAPWLDLAVLLPALFEAPPRQPLDFWLERFDIPVPVRHSALGDALATAQLALVALARARAQRVASIAALARLAAGARWLSG